MGRRKLLPMEKDARKKAKRVKDAIAVTNREPGRTAKGQWRKGNKLGKNAIAKAKGNALAKAKGDGRFSGRSLALRILDDVISEEKTAEGLRKALREYAAMAAIDFFKTIVMPLIPKESLLTVNNRTLAGVHLTFSGPGGGLPLIDNEEKGSSENGDDTRPSNEHCIEQHEGGGRGSESGGIGTDIGGDTP